MCGGNSAIAMRSVLNLAVDSHPSNDCLDDCSQFILIAFDPVEHPQNHRADPRAACGQAASLVFFMGFPLGGGSRLRPRRAGFPLSA